MANTIEIVIKATDSASRVIANVESNVTGSTKEIVKNLDEVGRASQTAQQKILDFGRGMSGLGDKLSVGVTLPLVAAGTAAIKFASDLNETTSKVGVLFGDMSDDIKKWSETSATSFGLSRRAALDGASDFAIFGKSAGLAGKNLNEFSKQNVKLASDMASFFNTRPEDAITAIGAAFRGETEPIRRYGVLINDASLKNEALRQGLIKTTTEALTPQQRILAASALIMQQTSAAQGDFARTSDQLANSTRIAKAQLEDAAAELGTNLLPLVNKGINLVNGLLKAFQELSPEMQNAILAFGGIAAALGPVMSVGGRLISLLPVIEKGFIAIKAAGAAMAVELGVIAAGLIAIAKYLGEVDAASKATTEDLMKMANSGDVFKQAAASTEILTHGQDRLKAALDATHEKIRTGAKNYADYKAAIDATAKAAGYEIDAQGNLVQVIYGTSGAVTKLVQANYALSESSYKADQISRTQAYGIDLLSSSSLRASDAIAQQAQTTADATVQQVDATARHTEIMRSYSNELLYNVQQYQAQQAAAEAAAAAEAIHRVSIADSIASVDKLAQSLKDATSAQAIQTIAQGQLDVLKKSFESGKIGAEDFKKATDSVLLTYGLATPKSIALAEAQDKINQAFLSGQLPLDKYIASTAQIPKIAADGKVTLQELTSLGIQPTTAAARDQTTAVDNLTIAWSKVPQNVKTVYTVETKGTVPSGTTGGTTGKGYATGGNFTVPSGYPNDSFPMRVSSGERVSVTPAGRGGNIPAINITQSFSGAQAQPEQYKAIMYEVITDVIEQAMRQ